MAANDIELVLALLPQELRVSKNGHTLLITGTNLMMPLLYHDDKMLKEAKEKATKYLLAKRTTLERSIIDFLLSLAEHDMDTASASLKNLCVASRKSNDKSPLSKCFCRTAHGLYHFAHFVLPEELFQKLEQPQDQGFILELEKWNKENGFSKGNLFFACPGIFL